MSPLYLHQLQPNRTPGGEAYYSEALQALNEYNRLIVIAGQEWDDGLTFYSIDLSEIFARD